MANQKITGRVHYDKATRVLAGIPDQASRTPRKYRVDVLTDHPAIPGPALTLTVLNDDGSVFKGYEGRLNPGEWVYTVANTETGLTCTCGDFEFRRANEEFPCKHVEYVVAANLMRK